MNVDERLEQVYAAPHGPQIGAFFDYDGTIITGYSATSFYNKRIKSLEMGPVELAKTLLLSVKGVHTPEEFAALLELSLPAWEGKTTDELAELGAKLFKSEIAGKLQHETWEIAQAHRAMGHTVVLASSATRFQVDPMAEAIGADHVLCTALEVRNGVITGRTEGPALWGPAKGRAAVRLAEEKGIDLDASFAYSNGGEDVPFLDAVGYPLAVSPDDRLREEAEARGWPVMECVPRGKRPGVVDLARTGAFYGAWGAAFGVGLGVGLLNRSRQLGVDTVLGLGSDVSLALAGVEVDIISGQEHLWSHRPAVFIFNHQSNVDAVVMMKLVRERMSGMAKKEAKNIPGFGQFFQIAGVAFLDRANSGKAIEAMRPAVDKIRDEGLSMVISPEGTRTPTPRLGPFKKGAFHLAMQAGVPIVPVVLKDVAKVQWRGSKSVRSGRIEVVVHPPIPTDDWLAENIAKHVDEVRQLFVSTIERWPGRPAPPLPDPMSPEGER
jgi:putative phosphoserine phosphatase/1-acylglycerol-3-phosphate O-acyltransferase